MAIGLAEAIGQQGDLRLPTRSVAPTKDTTSGLAKNRRVPTRDLTTTIAQKLLTFNKPVLPGDENERTNNAVMLVDGMYKKQSMDPNYNPLSDPEFVMAFSEFQVKENKMQDLYRRVSADIEQRQAGGAKFIDIWDVRKLTDATGPEFEAAKAAYNGGDKFAEVDIRTQFPWTKAVGTEFKLENTNFSVTKGGRNITQQGWDEKAKDADKVSRETIGRWLDSGSGTAKSLLQTSAMELMDEAKQQGGSFDLTDPTNKQKIKDRAYATAYGHFLAQNEMTKKDLKKGSTNFYFGGKEGGSGSYDFASGTYAFGSETLPSEFKQGAKNVNIVTFQPKAGYKKANLKDVDGNPVNQATISDLYFDENDNIIGGKAIWTYEGANIESYFKYEGTNATGVNAVLKDLDAAYEKYNPKAKKKLTEGVTIKKAGSSDTRSFVPDFLNDAIKNIGDFLRPRAPEPPQPGGPDVEGMV